MDIMNNMNIPEDVNKMDPVNKNILLAKIDIAHHWILIGTPILTKGNIWFFENIFIYHCEPNNDKERTYCSNIFSEIVTSLNKNPRTKQKLLKWHSEQRHFQIY